MTGAPWSASAFGRDQGDILVRRLSPDDDFVKVLPFGSSSRPTTGRQQLRTARSRGLIAYADRSLTAMLVTSSSVCQDIADVRSTSLHSVPTAPTDR
jgi:hypothetical protein